MSGGHVNHGLTNDLYRSARLSSTAHVASFARASRTFSLIACLGFSVFVVAVIFGRHEPTLWRDAWVYDTTIAAASLATLCMAWSRRRNEQLGRIAIGVGMLLWSLGDITWEIWRHHAHAVPTPSPADLLYLSMYPCVLVGLYLVRRGRGHHPSLSAHLDGLVVGLGVACIYELVMDPVFHNMTGGSLAMVTGFAYPISDLLLAALVLALLAAVGWHLDRFVILFALGCALFFLADSHFLLLSARGTYLEGTLWDAGWPAGLLLWSFAVRQPEPRRLWHQPGAFATLVAPVVVALTSVAVLLVGSNSSIPETVVVLASAAIVAVLVRTMISFREVAGAAEARRQALTDELTGLPNRRGLSRSIRMTTAAEAPLARALIIVSCTDIREITAAFGYVTSDQLLFDVSRRLRTATKDASVIARFREDQFALWIPFGPNRATLQALVEELLLSLAVPFPVDSIRTTVSVNIGVALFPEQATNEHDLFHHCEAALLSAIRKGSKYEVYEPVKTASAQSRLVLLEEFRLAVKAGQLICHYQPKVEIATGQVVGVEALVRWEHPRLGLLTPEVFLPLAQQAQLLHDVFQNVLSTAVEQSAAWISRGLSLHTSVNVTVSDLLNVDLAAFVQQVLQGHLVPPSALVIEVTEETFMHDPERVRDTLLSLHDLGIELSIDDFGTGYSSLSYLRRIPANELKIDRAFVTGVATDAFDQSVILSTVGLAHSLGMRAIAEGVESQSDMETLARLGCDLAQGYFLSRPLSAAAFEEWLANHDAGCFAQPNESPALVLHG